MAVSESHFRVMASATQIILVGASPSLVKKAEERLRQLEQLWSRFVSESDISHLNLHAGKPVEVDEQTIFLVEKMAEAWHLTHGGYDPTVLPVLVHSGYGESIDNPEDVTELSSFRLTSCVGMDRVIIDKVSGTCMLPLGMAIDPGGIGKGLAADIAAAELVNEGAAGALISIGGDIAMLGTPPSSEGWFVAIEDPLETSRSLTNLAISGGGIATSSTLSRRWLHDGVDCHHLIDPATGTQSTTDLATVTVVAQCAWQAEVHATAAMLTGSTGFLKYVDEHDLQAIATDLNGVPIATIGLSEAVTKQEVEV